MQTSPEKSLPRQFIGLAIPTLLSGFAYTLYTFVDGVFIGRYLGPQSLAALNLVVPLLYVPYALSLMIGVGGATLVARLSGQGQARQARRVFTQALWSMLAISVVLSALALILTPQIAQLLGAKGTLAAYVEEYLKAYGWFILFAEALYALELFLRVEGSKAAAIGLYAMLLGAIVNVALDYYLIVMWPFGMWGAGLATGISMLASSAAMMAYFVFKAKRVRPCRGAFRQGSQVGTMLFNGSSEFLDGLASVVTIFAFNRVILEVYGETGLAAYAILEYMMLGAAVAMIGFVQSMQPLVSFQRGAGNPRAIRTVLYLGSAGTLAVALLSAIVMLVFSHSLTFLFLPEGGAAWEILAHVVPWYASALLPAACNFIAAGYLTAIERPAASVIIAALRSWILLLGSLWVFYTYFGDESIWYAALFTEIATLAVSAWLMARIRPNT